MDTCPNILLFLTDDHGAWALGCHGNREVRSPHLDALARAGVRFANAFTPSPVCSPARACLLTGRTPSQVGLHDWLQEAEPEIAGRDWMAGERTLIELLAAAGYRTGLSGKWHLGRSHLTPRGLDYYFGLPGWQGDHIETYTYVENGRPLTLAGNKSQIIADKALGFLDAPGDQPFFLQVGFIATHSPYTGQSPELEASYAGASFADLPPYLPHPWRQNEGFRQSEAFGRADLVAKYRSYYAAVTEMDTQVGRLLARLRDQGQLDNTLVIYASDHGLALGHNGFWGKGNSTRPLNMYEVSIRVPLIVTWPAGGIAGGRVIERCVDHYDTFMAICAAAGATLDPSRAYPGSSWLGLAGGVDGGARLADEKCLGLPSTVASEASTPPTAAGSQDATLWDDTRFGEYGDLRMVRTPDYKLVRRYPDGPDELFDLRADLEEHTSVAGRPEMAAVEAELRERLEEWYARHEEPTLSGLRVKALPLHNRNEAWRDGLREARGLQLYEGTADG